VTLDEVVTRLFPLLEQHGALLRPKDLFPFLGTMEIWSAPGDSEMKVAYRNPEIQFVKHERPTTYTKDINLAMMGYEPEYYEPDEDGFRSERTEEGLPAQPEIRTPSEQKDMSESDMETLMDMMKDKKDNGVTP